MAIPAYLWLTSEKGEQIKGSVNIEGREGSAEIVELMHSVNVPIDTITGQITAKCNHGDYALIKEVDSMSPYLYQGVATGKRYEKAELKFYKIDDAGQEAEYFRTTLEGVRVSEIEPFMLNVKDPTFAKNNPLELFYLSYEKITWHHIDGNVIYTAICSDRRDA